MHVPDDGRAQQCRPSVSYCGHIHAQLPCVQVRYHGGAGDVHDHTCGHEGRVRLGIVRRVVSQQDFGLMHPDLREPAPQRVHAVVRQLHQHGKQDVLRHRPGERQEEQVHCGRVQKPDGHVQLHDGHMHKHHGRLRVRVQEHGSAVEVLGAPG
uniref:Uncharacterized protein n=1 Tax=Clastoptera arizonana TaxID=38151 RepID=A0A1B6CZT3_9HEMI